MKAYSELTRLAKGFDTDTRRALFFAAAGALLLATATFAAPAVRDAARSSKRPPAPVAPVVQNNPLLPPPINPEGFWPELLVIQKGPAMAPQGFAPLYSATDWQLYREKYGVQADELAKKKASAQVELAQAFLTAANDESERPGLKRLLLVRATVLAYRHKDGSALAGKALGAYRQVLDSNHPAQVAALWTLADAMARYSATPKSERSKYAALAARANIQLAVLLLDAGQIEAAQNVIKMLARHDPAIRADATLRPQATSARTLVRQTAALMEYLAGQCTTLARGDQSAAMPLYLYARLVKPTSSLVSEVLARRGTSAVGQLHAVLEQAQSDHAAAYYAGEVLKNVAAELPDGVLKHRTLYASLQYYRQFISAPETETERVKRTLARMAMQAVLADGARGAPLIRPFDPPVPTTTPAPLLAERPSTTAPAPH